MKRFLMTALIVAGVAHGTPAAQADYCPVWNPVNPKCWVAGAVAFEGSVTLSTFPCSPPSSCHATFNASLAAGTGISRDPGVGIVTGLSASVTYNEACTGGQAVAGSAVGSATLSGTNIVGSVLPLTTGFAWERVGLVAVITGNPVTAASVVGAAVFVPTGGLPSCTGGGVTATVAGAAIIP